MAGLGLAVAAGGGACVGALLLVMALGAWLRCQVALNVEVIKCRYPLERDD
jgi:hypothetical protein